jgi:hypothetical protein
MKSLVPWIVSRDEYDENSSFNAHAFWIQERFPEGRYADSDPFPPVAHRDSKPSFTEKNEQNLATAKAQSNTKPGDRRYTLERGIRTLACGLGAVICSNSYEQ